MPIEHVIAAFVFVGLLVATLLYSAFRMFTSKAD